MSKIKDFLVYEFNRLKRNFFGKDLVKYLLVITTSLAILSNNRDAMIYNYTLIFLYLFLDAYNDNEFLQWRSHQYKGDTKAMRRWHRKRLGEAGKIDVNEKI